MKLPRIVVLIMLWAAAWGTLCAQEISSTDDEAPGGGGEASASAALYRRLGSVGLDSKRVYRIRDARIEREDIHISLNDGVIAFTREVDGRITGAMFEGEGEILLRPPDQVERWSLSQFTGAAILEELFTSAYLRFNDDTFAELQSSLRPLQIAPPAAIPGEETDETADDAEVSTAGKATTPEKFLARWNSSARALAPLGVLRLLTTFVDAGSATGWQPPPNDRFLLVRLAGVKLGMFNVHYDSRAAEQIYVAQGRTVNGVGYYNVWTSFPSRSARERVQAATASVQTQTAAERWVDPVRIPRCTINARILPSRILQADTTIELEAREPGHRILVFELSRFLHVSQVTMEGRPLEFVQNEPIEGSELERRGNDQIAVVFPQALQPQQRIRVRFVYEGEVLSDAGGGLMYVGARGIWYPNRGFSMSEFDMEFRYPAVWTLVATGKRISAGEQNGEQVAHYVSERPMPVAGFNIGMYVKTEAKAGAALVQTYAARQMEAAFARRQGAVLADLNPLRRPGTKTPTLSTIPTAPPPAPSPNAQQVAVWMARTIDFLAERLGPFPYSSLAVTQIPGRNSQSWPGLIYLSGHSFLGRDELAGAQLGPMAELLFIRLMPAHETAHQWWGDLLLWNSYREQWLVEALSNYCVLLMIEKENPAGFRSIMEMYRRELIETREGHALSDAGPVTLGVRLYSSRFPEAYERIAYGRGTWLFHMLRHMLLDADSTGGRQRRAKGSAVSAVADDRFFAVLRRLRERFEGREITTRDVQQAFEELLPDSLRYEGRRSMEWFFDNWVNGTQVPQIELAQVRLAGVTATGHILQKQVASDFVTSVPLYAELASGNSTLIGRLYAEGPDTAFRLTVPAGTRRIVLDPYQTILRK